MTASLRYSGNFERCQAWCRGAGRRIKKKPETWDEADVPEGEEKDLVGIRTPGAADNPFLSKA